MRDTVKRIRTRTLGHLERGAYVLAFDGDRVCGRLVVGACAAWAFRH